MYGIVNIAMEDFVLDHYSTEQWTAIKHGLGGNIDFSFTEQPYNDDVTYAVATAVAEETGMQLDDVLFGFGKYIIKTVREKFSSIMSSRGDNLREYLLNIPGFHNRIMLIYPNFNPPEFRVSRIEDNSVYVHYMSRRAGMNSYIRGYLSAIVDNFNETATIEPIPYNEKDGQPQEIFKISW